MEKYRCIKCIIKLIKKKEKTLQHLDIFIIAFNIQFIKTKRPVTIKVKIQWDKQEKKH